VRDTAATAYLDFVLQLMAHNEERMRGSIFQDNVIAYADEIIPTVNYSGAFSARSSRPAFGASAVSAHLPSSKPPRHRCRHVPCSRKKAAPHLHLQKPRVTVDDLQHP